MSKYDYDTLAPIVASSKSLAEVLGKLGLKKAGGNYRYLNERIRALGLDIGHFAGQSWARGLTSDTSKQVGLGARKREVPDDEVFVENCRHGNNGPRLGKRLIRLGRAYVCAVCGISEWLGTPLTLHLDHINGIHNDNRLENLRFLCPNCHQQTDTWGSRKLREVEPDWFIAPRAAWSG
jgi:hypothetical protein